MLDLFDHFKTPVNPLLQMTPPDTLPVMTAITGIVFSISH
jgi:hypothetical protein